VAVKLKMVPIGNFWQSVPMGDRITVDEAGSRGGKSRAAKQTPEQRSALARKAAKARWAKAKKRKK
jgi:hypothetical protein